MPLNQKLVLNKVFFYFTEMFQHRIWIQNSNNRETGFDKNENKVINFSSRVSLEKTGYFSMKFR